jgi:multiple sugar transport system substrate-binding protein
MPRRGGRRGARLPAALVLVGALAATAGCGGLSETRLLGSDTGGALTTLGFGFSDEIATSRVDVFKKKYPDVELKVNEGAFDAQQFLSAVASGRPPDLVYMDRDLIGSYAHRGALEPLNSCVQRAGIRTGDYRDYALDQVTVDDTLYGIPEFVIAQMVLVNGKAAADAGVRPQDIDTSDWTALRQLGEKMTKRSGGKLSRLGFYPKMPDYFPLWVQAGGGRILSPDGTRAELDSTPAQAAMSYARSVYDPMGGYATVKAFSDSWDFFGEKNELATDQVGIMPMDSWYLNTLAEVSPKAPITVLPFKDRTGKPTAWAGGSAWAIPKGAKHPDQACDFMATMTATSTWVTAAKVRAAARAKDKLPFTGLYTANKAADDEIFRTVYKPSGTAWVDQGVQVLRSLQDTAFATPPSPAGAEVKNEWQAAGAQILLDRKDPGSVLHSAQKQAQAAIDATNAQR